MENKKNQRKQVSEMTRGERLSLQAFKNVMERKKVAQKTKHLTEAHKRNSEKAMVAINNIVPSEIDWEKELERQKKNATNS